MKKYLYFTVALIAALFTSCAKDDDATTNNSVPQPTEAAASSWTVMFYSVGGGNLDSAQVSNMAEAFLSTQKTNINMTFEFKFSNGLQANAPFKGVKFFDMADERGNVSLSKLNSKQGQYQQRFDWIKDIKGEQIGDASYDMGKAAALQAFISKSIAKHPADHYMLILSDHGSGFNVAVDPDTRAILADDNLQDQPELSLMDCVAGIKAGMGGKRLDVLYDDACDMAAIENIYQYQTIARYFIGAEEVTPGQGGDYTKLLNLISADPTNTLTVANNAYSGWAKDYVDYLVSVNQWQKDATSQVYADCGVYDLDKFQSAINAFFTSGGFTNVFYDVLNSTTEPAALAALNKCVMSAQVDVYVGYSENSFEFNGKKITLMDLQNDYAANKRTYLDKLKNGDETYLTGLKNATQRVSVRATLCDFMKRCADNVTLSDGSKPFADPYNKFVDALKSSAYLVNTVSGKDPYRYTSPSINLYGLSDEALKENAADVWYDAATDDLKNNLSIYAGSNADKIEALYNKTAFGSFETQWGWMKCLKKLNVNVGALTNPSFENNKD